MDFVTTAFEKLALLLRPLGVAFGLAAAALFMREVLGVAGILSPPGSSTTVAMLWACGLALLVAWFKPGPPRSETGGRVPSAARRFGRGHQVRIVSFFLFWFGFSLFLTAIDLRNAG